MLLNGTYLYYSIIFNKDIIHFNVQLSRRGHSIFFLGTNPK